MGIHTYQRGENTKFYKELEATIAYWLVGRGIKMHKYQQHELAKYIFDTYVDHYEELLNEMSVIVTKHR